MPVRNVFGNSVADILPPFYLFGRHVITVKLPNIKIHVTALSATIPHHFAASEANSEDASDLKIRYISGILTVH